jgi:hypothetical protein
MNAITSPDHFIKFSATRHGNSTGTRDYGEFQIHSSTRLFPVWGVTYFGTEKMRIELADRNRQLLTQICGMYNVGGQSLTCNEGVEQEDGSLLYSGSYDCWSD